jgi:hypothetical protein
MCFTLKDKQEMKLVVELQNNNLVLSAESANKWLHRKNYSLHSHFSGELGVNYKNENRNSGSVRI